MQAMDPEDYDGPPEAFLKLAEQVDVLIAIRAAANTNETGDVLPEKNTAFARVMKSINDETLEKRWVGTQHPAPGNAQDAEMSTEAYADFVHRAVNKDWDEQRAFQSKMVDLLEKGSEVRIVSGETTDIALSIDGMILVNDHAEKNLPGGEVYTAPVPGSAEGEVLFDEPLLAHGVK